MAAREVPAVHGGQTVAHDLNAVAGWEVPAEALFVCRAHTDRGRMEAEFGAADVVPVTWAQVELSDFYCALGDHHLTAEADRPPSPPAS